MMATLNCLLQPRLAAAATGAVTREGAAWWVEFGLEALAVVMVIAIGLMLRRRSQRNIAELQDSEKRFAELFEHAIEGIYENPAGGGFRRANPAMARLLGYESPEALMKVTPEETARLYVSPTRRAEFFALLGDRDYVKDFESEVRRPDGTTVWIKENVRAVRDERGRLLYLQGFVSDITSRRAAEVALRESEMRYRQLFEYSPVAIIEIDSRETIAKLRSLRESGVTDLAAWFAGQAEETWRMLGHIPIIGVNSAALRLFAAKSAEEVRDNLDRIFTAEAVAMRKEALLAVWEGRNAVEGEIKVMALDGTMHTVFNRWWVPQEAGRPLLERTQLALVDLTEAKSATSALAEERERLTVTLRAMTEGVITTDLTGCVLFMNEAAGELTGWPPAAAVGRPFSEVCQLSHEKTGRAVASPASAALAADGPVDLPPRTMLRGRAGEGRLIEGRCAPMHDLKDRGIGAVLVLRDVGERTRLEAEMLRASKLESIGLLAGGIAHDFNNLLAVVMGNVTLALLNEQTAANAGRWLREAERATLRARELTQQLLTFSRGGEPVRAAVRLTDIVREAAEFALHGSAVKCEFDLAVDVRPADADRGQIGQVVQNLVINAVQAMPAGGVIRLALRNETIAAGNALPLPAGGYLRLDVADSGKGIAPEHLARIFDPFFTTKEHGSGLGLATVFSVVKKHHGHVTVESEVGRGTTFRLWLPAAQVEPAEKVVSGSPFAPLQGRVLFMDDEEPIRTMTQALLERLGLEATVAADGGAAVQQFALARASGRPFDVVIMDLTVPGAMGGAQAMQEILKLDPEARGIVSSGYSSDPVMANHRAHGFRAMVPKPYRIADFTRTLRELLVTNEGR